MKSQPYDYGIPGFPLEHSEGASPSQQRDLKNFENSLIHLTASLDLEKVRNISVCHFFICAPLSVLHDSD